MHVTKDYSGLKLFIHILSGLIITLSTIIITFLLYLFAKHKRIVRNSINIFILNIIINDLLRCTIYLPSLNYSVDIIYRTIANYLDHHIYTPNDKVLTLFCNFQCFLGIFFETIQLVGMVFISFERYTMIVLPPTTKEKKFKLAKFYIYVTWGVSLATTLTVFILISVFSELENINNYNCHIELFHLNIHSFDFHQNSTNIEFIDYVNDQKQMSLIQNRIYDICSIVITFIAITIILCFYAKIFFYLRNHAKKIEHKDDDGKNSKICLQSVKSNVPHNNSETRFLYFYY